MTYLLFYYNSSNIKPICFVWFAWELLAMALLGADSTACTRGPPTGSFGDEGFSYLTYYWLRLCALWADIWGAWFVEIRPLFDRYDLFVFMVLVVVNGNMKLDKDDELLPRCPIWSKSWELSLEVIFSIPARSMSFISRIVSRL